MNNIDIAGGTINNVTIGIDGAGPIIGTTITTGAPNGSGFDIIFYGDTVGEYASWLASLGLFNISGDLFVSGITDLGNIRISGNTISSTNTNGNIVIDPAGTGCLLINSCVHQNSVSGNVTFNVVNGIFNASSTGNAGITSTSGKVTINSNKNTVLNSSDGAVVISSGTSPSTSIINFIGTGVDPLIVSNSASNVEVGDIIKFTGTNSVPTITGEYTVTQVIDSTSFRISGLTVTGTGNTGSFTKDSDIYLNTNANINVPSNVKLTFGGDTNYLFDNGDLNVVSDSALNLTSTTVNLPDNVKLSFGSGSQSIKSAGTELLLDSGSINLTGSVSTTDPILKLNSGVPGIQDKGIEFNYLDGTSNLGWFGYDNSNGTFSFFKSATNNNEIISGTLGDATFGRGNFTNLVVGTIDACNINCPGIMTLTAGTSIRLNTGSIQVPAGSDLQIGNAIIKKEAAGDDLLINSQGHIFLTPASAKDVILPTLSGLVLNGENGANYIKSNSVTELTISSSSFLNLNQISGGVRLTEELPLIFNQNETTNLIGDSAGNLLVNSENSINLLPASGQVSIPVNKRLELGSSTSYIGSTALNTVVLSTPGTIGVSSTGNQTYTTSGNINLSPVGSVILPVEKNLQLGGATQIIKGTTASGLLMSTPGTIDVSSDIINLTPVVAVNIPYSKPLTFGTGNSLTGTAGNLLITSDSSTISGNLTVNGTNTVINSSNVTISDPILTLGTSVVDDNKDRGIEYRYKSGSLDLLGFFGMDDTDGSFMYVPTATNTGEVISGALGNVKFGSGSFTGLNLNDGNISSVNTISSTSTLTLDPGPVSDIVFNVDSGSNVIIPVNVDLLFGSENNKIYSDGTNLHIVDNAIIDGNTTVNGDLTVTGNVSIVGGTTVNFTVQRFSVIGNASMSPNSSSNATFISVSSAGVASGTLPVCSIDGFIKNICISSLASGATYELLFPTGRLLNPGTGTSVATKIIFDCPGQGIQLLWDNVLGSYIITFGGGEIVIL
jgi:hypothetical protein